jgi:hypothetical protein
MIEYYGRQTCLNGHVISNYVGSEFETKSPFCRKCGAETITDCPACGKPQQGAVDGGAYTRDLQADSYCHNCGKPYPWTERRLEATSELVQEEEQLNEKDKRVLNASLPDLVTDTPSTVLAATRFKKIVGSVGGGFKSAMYQFVVDVSSETAKKIVLGE